MAHSKLMVAGWEERMPFHHMIFINTYIKTENNNKKRDRAPIYTTLHMKHQIEFISVTIKQ